MRAEYSPESEGSEALKGRGRGDEVRGEVCWRMGCEVVGGKHRGKVTVDVVSLFIKQGKTDYIKVKCHCNVKDPHISRVVI